MGQELPKVFEERMKDMLGDEFAAYLASYENVRQYGLRINPLKISGKELEETGYFHLQQIPWVRDGFFYQEEDQPARHPFYAAGFILSSGTQRHDTGFPFEDRTGRASSGSVRSSRREGNCSGSGASGKRSTGGERYQ